MKRYRAVFIDAGGTLIHLDRRSFLHAEAAARNARAAAMRSGRALEDAGSRMFRIAMERAGIGPGEAVYVGDSHEIDVPGARAAGLDAILLAAHGAAVQDVPTIHAFRDLGALLLDSNLRTQ